MHAYRKAGDVMIVYSTGVVCPAVNVGQEAEMPERSLSCTEFKMLARYLRRIAKEAVAVLFAQISFVPA